MLFLTVKAEPLHTGALCAMDSGQVDGPSRTRLKTDGHCKGNRCDTTDLFVLRVLCNTTPPRAGFVALHLRAHAQIHEQILKYRTSVAFALSNRDRLVEWTVQVAPD